MLPHLLTGGKKEPPIEGERLTCARPIARFGADLFHLRVIENTTKGIDGAGTFEVIVLSGIVAAIWYVQRPFHPYKHNGFALLLQGEADIPINSRRTEEQGYTEVPTWLSPDVKFLNISGPSPVCSIIDKKARSLLIFFTDKGMEKGLFS